MLPTCPLGATQNENIPERPRVLSKSNARDGEARLKQAREAVAEERRKRAEAEGAMQAAHAERDCVLAEIQHLRRTQEVAQTSAPIQDEVSPASRPELESRLQSLIKKYEGSKVKATRTPLIAQHAAELNDLRMSNTSLQSLADSLQHSLSTDKQTITELRSEKAVLRKELETLRSKPPAVVLKETKTDELSRLKDERASWRKEKMELETEIKGLRKQAMENERLMKELECVSEERDCIQTISRDSATAYRILCRETVSVGQYREVYAELMTTQLRCSSLTEKLRMTRREARDLKEDNSEAETRLKELQAERNELASDLHDLLQERRSDRKQINFPVARWSKPSISPLEGALNSEYLAIITHLISHIDILSSHTSHQIDNLSASLSSLRCEAEAAQSTLSSTRSTLSALETTNKQTKEELATATAAHEDCANQIFEWRGEASRAAAQEARLKSQLHEVKVELEDLQIKAGDERERLKRANEAGMRWGAAKEAMEDELASLRRAAQAQAEWDSKYRDLQEKYAILVSREETATDEAERLGAQNAELIGHANDRQRISYVDGIRREMARVKHELATTRHHLNIATDQISSLTAEIESYKSIGSDLLTSTGTGRVRVTRRQPEGGDVLVASVSKRSVSNPKR